MKNKKRIIWAIITVVVFAIATVSVLSWYVDSHKMPLVIQQNQTASLSVITLSSDGGETVSAGQHVKVTWSVDLNYPNVQVMIVAGKSDDGYTNNGSMGTFRGYVVYTGANTGSFDWIVPTDYPDAGEYLIRSQPLTSDGKIAGQAGYSNNYFTIQ